MFVFYGFPGCTLPLRLHTCSFKRASSSANSTLETRRFKKKPRIVRRIVVGYPSDIHRIVADSGKSTGNLAADSPGIVGSQTAVSHNAVIQIPFRLFFCFFSLDTKS
jgi:hypothetical protein